MEGVLYEVAYMAEEYYDGEALVALNDPNSDTKSCFDLVNNELSDFGIHLTAEDRQDDQYDTEIRAEDTQ